MLTRTWLSSVSVAVGLALPAVAAAQANPGTLPDKLPAPVASGTPVPGPGPLTEKAAPAAAPVSLWHQYTSSSDPFRAASPYNPTRVNRPTPLAENTMHSFTLDCAIPNIDPNPFIYPPSRFDEPHGWGSGHGGGLFGWLFHNGSGCGAAGCGTAACGGSFLAGCGKAGCGVATGCGQPACNAGCAKATCDTGCGSGCGSLFDKFNVSWSRRSDCDACSSWSLFGRFNFDWFRKGDCGSPCDSPCGATGCGATIKPAALTGDAGAVQQIGWLDKDAKDAKPVAPDYGCFFCSSFASEARFIFGSCRSYYGEPTHCRGENRTVFVPTYELSQPIPSGVLTVTGGR